jgi:putative nucleotidyltransferase with HDIG domain
VAVGSDLRLSEVVAALSYALDVTEGQPFGHAVRSCLIGMRLAHELALPVDDRAALFYGLLLKDAGCSSNAARITSLFGVDDFAAKANVKLIDHASLPRQLGYVLRNTDGPRGLARAMRAGPGTLRRTTEIRCERGAEIARMLELPEETATAIYSLDEHWDGKGHPEGRAGREIPLLARILCLAQTVEVFHATHGLEAALAVARRRSGRWFDPQLVAVFERTCADPAFWTDVTAADAADRVLAEEPPDRMLTADDQRLDRLAEAFARVIDAKSPYTFRHSERVAEVAVAVAVRLGFDADGQRDLRRAGLLHDIGKLAVSNLILDKPGALDADELAAMRRHPAQTYAILSRVRVFGQLAETAAAHHERLDGSGYHRGVGADELDLPARVLAVADVFEALTAVRPYRDALPLEQALAIVSGDAGTRLDADAVDALAGVAATFA